MEEINRFVVMAQSGRYTVTELCEQFGISRKTGYKHLERYAAEGMKGLQVRSHQRAPSIPAAHRQAVEALIVAERRLHRTWGDFHARVSKATSKPATAGHLKTSHPKGWHDMV